MIGPVDEAYWKSLVFDLRAAGASPLTIERFVLKAWAAKVHAQYAAVTGADGSSDEDMVFGIYEKRPAHNDRIVAYRLPEPIHLRTWWRRDLLYQYLNVDQPMLEGREFDQFNPEVVRWVRRKEEQS